MNTPLLFVLTHNRPAVVQACLETLRDRPTCFDVWVMVDKEDRATTRPVLQPSPVRRVHAGEQALFTALSGPCCARLGYVGMVNSCFDVAREHHTHGKGDIFGWIHDDMILRSRHDLRQALESLVLHPHGLVRLCDPQDQVLAGLTRVSTVLNRLSGELLHPGFRHYCAGQDLQDRAFAAGLTVIHHPAFDHRRAKVRIGIDLRADSSLYMVRKEQRAHALPRVPTAPFA